MENFADEGKVVGFVFDLSLRHDSIGNRLIDEVKNNVVSLIMETFENNVDMMYLYHPKIFELVSNQGDQTSSINNYDSDGYKFNLEIALKQTMYLLHGQYFDIRKYLIFITDRVVDSYPIEKFFLINKKYLLGVHLIIVGIGEFYDKSMIEKLVIGQDATHIHINHPSELLKRLIKE